MATGSVQVARGARDTASGGGPMAALVVSLFFTWGFVTVLNDPLIAKLKGLFALNYAEAMLTQFAFFLGYFIFSAPAGAILGRFGYIRSIVLGLVIMAAGCLIFAPAARYALYPVFLLALFCVASGITILQVAANPYIAALGSAATSHSRLTLAQAFNSLGTFAGPFIGALFILQNGVATPNSASATLNAAARIHEAQIVQRPFLVIAGLLLLFALLFWTLRNRPSPASSTSSPNPFRRALLKQPRLIFGVACIFVYVGAEVSIGSGLTNYLMQPAIIGARAPAIGAGFAGLLNRLFGITESFNTAQVAGAMVSLYWGLAMLGRFAGSFILSRATPGKVLCVHALAAMVLALGASLTAGPAAAFAVLAIGLANSIMFPTIFTLALEGLGEETANGSALLCMAIVGGAIVPVIYGATADSIGLGHALIVPAACYLIIASYGLLTARGLGLARAT
jgi:FHS family L-fucose permease-like MFS transporter